MNDKEAFKQFIYSIKTKTKFIETLYEELDKKISDPRFNRFRKRFRLLMNFGKKGINFSLTEMQHFVVQGKLPKKLIVRPALKSTDRMLTGFRKVHKTKQIWAEMKPYYICPKCGKKSISIPFMKNSQGYCSECILKIQRE